MTALEEMVLAGGRKCGGTVRVVRTSPRLDAVRRLLVRGLVEPAPDQQEGDLVLEYRLTPAGHMAASQLLQAA